MRNTASTLVPPAPAASPTSFDIRKIREDFPILKLKVNGKPLVYLDNAATSQKPQSVIDAIVRFYELDCSNVHRGVHRLSEQATQAYEGARHKAQSFLNAKETREIIFVRGTTEEIGRASCRERV